ncbi:hypothetical protein C3B55_00412 [Candidatus Pseudomonas adelgestsugas]|uniref:Uncharacterized protein n=1 Tax=Candidatus Pseudomonas adelgestsugas TaxID=1302376 RepID=A0ABX5R877_9PSED|nr:hypothetical protein C3B55_00412 [Candidatus Pseudomonas adelgestsugas]
MNRIKESATARHTMMFEQSRSLVGTRETCIQRQLFKLDC